MVAAVAGGGETERAGDSEPHGDAVEAGASVDVVVLAGVDDVEAGDPGGYGGAEDEGGEQVGGMGEHDVAADRDPGGDRREAEGGAEPEVGERGESFGVAVAGEEGEHGDGEEERQPVGQEQERAQR